MKTETHEPDLSSTLEKGALMKSSRILRTVVLPLVLMLIALLSAFSAGFLVRPWFDDTFQTGYPLLNEVVKLLGERGIKELPPARELEYGLIRGALQAYDDPFTVFVEPAQNELQSNELQGKFGGIGARTERDLGGFLLLYPFPESPAAQAGIQDGDRLLRVDDLAVATETPTDQVEAALRGPVGQAVQLLVGRAPDYAPTAVAVKRAEVPLPSLTWNITSIHPQVGVIRVNVIAATTPSEVQKAVEDLIQRGASHFVLDLRDNGGGLLDAGIDTAKLFLSEGVVITQQYRGEATKEYRVEREGELAQIPLTVLINQNTASSAEIIAGALQAQDRARLVGTRTYGKDTIQLVYNLKDGSSLHVTAARWWLPGMEAGISGSGLLPDIEVPADADPNIAFIQAAVQDFGLP